MVGLKTVPYAKISPKSGEPQRYSWGTQKKKKKKKKKKDNGGIIVTDEVACVDPEVYKCICVNDSDNKEDKDSDGDDDD